MFQRRPRATHLAHDSPGILECADTSAFLNATGLTPKKRRHIAALQNRTAPPSQATAWHAETRLQKWSALLHACGKYRLEMRTLLFLLDDAHLNFSEACNFRQARQNLFLNAVSEIGVGLLVASVFERHHSDAFFRNGARSALLDT